MPDNIFSDVVGKTPAEALVVVLPKGINCIRVCSVDGEYCLATADYRTDRLNVEVVDGKISKLLGTG